MEWLPINSISKIEVLMLLAAQLSCENISPKNGERFYFYLIFSLEICEVKLLPQFTPTRVAIATKWNDTLALQDILFFS